MFLMDLSAVLEMPSNDAFAFNRCSECGTAWRWWDRLGGRASRPCACSLAFALDCETVGHILNAKVRDPWFLPLLMDIAENGKDTPALIVDDTMYNGHHGIAALAVLGWAEIPVTESAQEYVSAGDSSGWEEGSPDLGYDS